MDSKKKKAITGAALTLGIAGLGGITASAESIQSIAADAVPVAEGYGLYPSVMIAQAILESGSGTSELAVAYNNFFGVKYTSGEGVDMPTTEYIDGQAQNVTETFQVYGSPEESFAAHAELLSNYYPGTLVANTTSYLDALSALQGRYATDPNYSTLLNSIITSYDLTAYDGGASYTTPAEAAEPAQTGSYVVKSGDSLWNIAQENGLSASDLASINGIDQNSTLQIGQSLTLAGSSTQSDTSNAGATGIYIVQAGDSLWRIAQANGTTTANLASLNGIDENSILHEGQPLSLSSQNVTNNPAIASGTYTVQAGDTLSGIAANSGHSVNELAAMNGLADANILAVGQVLNV
ncbi:MAG: LysM peptidoglycan-binding domain-containing protein [Streptococcaceae bacterium]|nr:LysM peptidoglycan-binding domain-containing protein [Streptococcaceae bacterium]